MAARDYLPRRMTCPSGEELHTNGARPRLPLAKDLPLAPVATKLAHQMLSNVERGPSSRTRRKATKARTGLTELAAVLEKPIRIHARRNQLSIRQINRGAVSGDPPAGDEAKSACDMDSMRSKRFGKRPSLVREEHCRARGGT